jgi:hypothetical protein
VPGYATIFDAQPHTLASVADYLSRSFDDGDREFIDGELLESNVGEVDHSEAQAASTPGFCPAPANSDCTR